MNTQERKLKTRFVYIPPKIILFAYNTLGTSNFGFMCILQESLENPKTVYYAVCGRGGIFGWERLHKFGVMLKVLSVL